MGAIVTVRTTPCFFDNRPNSLPFYNTVGVYNSGPDQIVDARIDDEGRS
jgi:hypothetical protein